jgi:hypothetical protein
LTLTLGTKKETYPRGDCQTILFAHHALPLPFVCFSEQLATLVPQFSFFRMWRGKLARKMVLLLEKRGL